jgi:hypothetical protein
MIVPSGRTMSIGRMSPDVYVPRASSRYLNATPTTDFASRNVAFTDVRAWRELPEKSTSARSPAFVIRTWTRYSSSSAAPSASR